MASLAVISILISSQPLCLGASGSVCKQTKPAFSSTSAIDSIVVDHYVFDATLKRSWAVMIDCRHPDWPAQAIEIRPAVSTSPAASAALATAPRPSIPVIRSGSPVELWQDGKAHIQLSGIAMESAIVGQSIQVRAGLGSSLLRGIVRGPHSVELTEDNTTGRREP
ncbi:MAG TPA: hypothetical protein VHT28_17190 [Silvibacterium sp.]|jgi:hypothetical protein|nr:hypothetical protein [Silvibacterium sp.]